MDHLHKDGDQAFEALREVLRQAGLCPEGAERVKNTYWPGGSQYRQENRENPWLRIPIHGVELMLGMRKNVLGIQVTSSAEYPTGRIGEITSFDKVTFSRRHFVLQCPGLGIVHNYRLVVHALNSGSAAEYLISIFKDLEDIASGTEGWNGWTVTRDTAAAPDAV